MPIPPALWDAIGAARVAVAAHPRRQFLPVQRLAIYRALHEAAEPNVALHIRGWLAILAARRVLPRWQAAVPLYPDKVAAPGAPDPNRLAEHYLALAAGVIGGTVPTGQASQEDADHWYVVGNIETEIFEWREDADAALFAAFYALDAAYKALHEALGHELLGTLRGWEAHTDDSLPRFAADAAASAVLAASGGGDDPRVAPLDPDQRQAFWEWWLTEAIPAAWRAAGGT